MGLKINTNQQRDWILVGGEQTGLSWSVCFSVKIVLLKLREASSDLGVLLFSLSKKLLQYLGDSNVVIAAV